ncbi:hypothetical protein [Rufibacter sp. LB8]|uniref:hypothetical protein n=1 Tax=Rufibacter sp. LB8 TaxID=2777781 RepID=UPI00178C3F72|nr:hypothetical protein [Rufibacter sp. LB8]
MILENTFVKLDYNPAKDLLYVDWPDYNNLALAEFNHLLEKILDVIKFYDIGFMLIDARTTVDAIKELEFIDAAIKFLDDLGQTRIKKVARVVTNSSVREARIREHDESGQLTLNFQSFTSKEVALRWLES